MQKIHPNPMDIFRNPLPDEYKFNIVCNLAAQAGVRYSILNPKAYIDSNISGFLNILESSKKFNVEKLVYASSSSVYGNTKNIPFSETENLYNPISLYAATKISNELMAKSYKNLFGLNSIGLRFFTVYGPYGRPDMAAMIFADSIFNNKEFKVFNNGKLERDFTYIDDIISGIIPILFKSKTKFDIYNIGYGSSVNLLDFIKEFEKNLNKKPIKIMTEMQDGDVYKTWSNTDRIKTEFNYEPKIGFQQGVKKFLKWYTDFITD